MNPFEENPIDLEGAFQNWKQLFPAPYNKRDVDPYTKTRIILMNGAEFEANWFSHQFARHCSDNELRRELAVVRMLEKQQQIKISLLKPGNESILEHTISYEQLAVDLTAELARRETDCNVKRALDFALLEDFDHLYRYANLLEAEAGIYAERLVGRYTEIMPGRPTISHHRFPRDNVRRSTDESAAVQTTLSAMIITAAEQQTMNYYMNVTNLYPSDPGRRLYEEIALVEEEHVTQYESLLNPMLSWLENLLWHEFNECYLYYSCYQTETMPYIKLLWEQNLAIEIAHLHRAAALLEKYEGKTWQEVIPVGEFPAPVSLHENIEYVRQVLGSTVQFTSVEEDYYKIEELPSDADFFAYQQVINPSASIVPSHNIIESMIRRNGRDYRFQTAPNPVPELRCRTEDNTSVGRVPGAAQSTDFDCN